MQLINESNGKPPFSESHPCRLSGTSWVIEEGGGKLSTSLKMVRMCHLSLGPLCLASEITAVLELNHMAKKSAKVAKTVAAKTVLAKPTKPRKAISKSSTSKPSKAAKPVVKLLSGGNPQIAKGYGDAPVRAYIAAMPGWKSEVGHRLDALIERTVPGVSKAVKWNSPFYGIEEGNWFLGIHCFAKYIKVAFFRGASLRPLPPGTSKQKEVRYLDIHEDDPLDEAQLADWVQQASQLPGERM